MGPSIITFAGYLLILFLDLANSTTNRRCFPLYREGSLCFIRPDSLVALSWSDAQQWCSNIGATLPNPHTYNHQAIYGNALGYFGFNNRTMWLGANSTFDLNDWYWTNGTRFTGKIDHGNNTLKTQAYIVRNGTDIEFVAADPRIAQAGFICQPPYYQNDERLCAGASNSFWSNGRCYTKNRNQHHDWNSFVYNCGGLGNLPSFDDLNEMSQWIDDQTKFWIGLSCTWWTWQDTVSGNSFELSDSRFGGNFPNNTSPECLASYDNSYGNMYWMNQKCSKELQFICQQHADPTTTTKTTMSTSTTTRRPSSATTTTRITATTMNSTPSKTFSATPRPPSTITPDANDSDEDIDESDDRYGLVVSLGFGLCGGLLFLAGIIWLAALTARVYKINRNSPKALQKQRSELLQLSYSNPYEIPPFDNTRNL